MRLFAVLLALVPAAAFAQAADAAPMPQSPFAGMLPLVAIFAVMYFLMIRPQQKRMKEHQAMVADLKKGDEVVTAGGIVGKVTRADAGETITVEISKGVEVSVVKATISNVVGKVNAAKTTEKKTPAHNDSAALPSKEKVANDN